MRRVRFRQFLSQRPLLQKVATLAGGTAIAQGLTIAAAPLLSRLYTPEDFGSLAVYASLLSMLGLAASGRYELAIALPSEEVEARAVAGVAFSLLATSVVILTAGLTAIDVVEAAPFYSWLEPFWPYRWLLPPGVLGLGAWQILQAWTLRQQAYGVIASTRMRQSVGGVTTGVTGGWLLPAAWGLVAGQVVQQTFGAFRLGRFFAGPDSFRRAAFPGRARWRQAQRTYFRFASLSTGAGLLNLSAVALPPLIIAAYYDSGVTGSFNFAFRIVSLPMMLIGIAMSQVFFGEAAAQDREGNRDASLLFRKVVRHMAPPAVALALAGLTAPWVFPLVFGAEWRQAGVFATFLAVSCTAQLIVSPISALAILRQRQGLQLALDAFRALLVVASLTIPGVMQWPAEYAVIAFSCAMVFSFAVYFIAYRYLAYRDASS